MEKIG